MRASSVFIPTNRIPANARRVQRREAEANIKKWGKILSAADTFDERAPKGKSAAGKQDKNAGGGIVVAISGAAILAMLAASVQQ